MKEHQLTQETQLTPNSLSALGGFHHAFDVLRGVLDDDLRARVKEISGSVRDDYDTSVAVVRERMFVLRSRPQNLWIDIGFWLPAGEDGFPGAFGDIVFNHKCTGKPETLCALREFAKQRAPNWQEENLTDVAPWGRVVRGRTLAAFLAEPNHVAALRSYFHAILDEIAEFRRMSPELCWQKE
jgi:hypothetical protein